MVDVASIAARVPELVDAAALRETVWSNLGLRPWADTWDALEVTASQVDAAESRLARLAPLVAEVFPETASAGGLIESPLVEAPQLRDALGLPGRLLLKLDGELPIAGSVKARGGIYEVLAHAEAVALAEGLLPSPDADPRVLAGPRARAAFARHTIRVGSTGNLGLAIGLSAAALGFRAVVHLSTEAAAWKQDLLRDHGVEVERHAGDYSAAVAAGRAASAAHPHGHFIDDERSLDLLLGYAVGGRRAAAQLDALGATPTPQAPLTVHLPCGVGGAPAGITLGLKLALGDAVTSWAIQSTGCPGMLVGLATGLHDQASVADLGLDGRTEADGLAVPRPSGLAARLLEHTASGVITCSDARLRPWLGLLRRTEGVRAEPSAAAGLRGPTALAERDRAAASGTHLVWLTGGGIVPDAVLAALGG